MAAQLHFAYSSVFSGSGIVAGPSYYCAQGNTFTAIGQCMSGPALWIRVSKLKSQLQSYVSAGSADPSSNLMIVQLLQILLKSTSKFIHQSVLI
jgi:hypothetical protein